MKIVTILLLFMFISQVLLRWHHFENEKRLKNGNECDHILTYDDILQQPKLHIFLEVIGIISWIFTYPIYIVAQTYHVIIFLLSVQFFIVCFFPRLEQKFRKIHRKIRRKTIHFYWILFIFQVFHYFIKLFYQHPNDLTDFHILCFLIVVANILHILSFIFGRKRAISFYQSNLRKYIIWLTSFGGAANLVG